MTQPRKQTWNQRQLIAMVTAMAVALTLTGCGGGTGSASSRSLSNGASFHGLTGGGTGGPYEIPMAPPALDSERDPRCEPGLRYLPIEMVAMGEGRIPQLRDMPPIRVGVMDDMPDFDPEAKVRPILVSTMRGDRDPMVPPELRIDVSAYDRTPGVNPDHNAKPIDLSRYRFDEVWWCDPTDQRKLR